MFSARATTVSAGVLRSRVRGAVLTASAVTGLTAVVTGTNRAGLLPVSRLAATPQAVGEGKLWLLLTSGLLADRPAVPSLVGFWLVGFAVLLVCSPRVVAGVALGGHTLSALAVYGVIALTRVLDPQAFASVAQLADYGLSAMIAAWLGAIACVFWRRQPARLARVLIVVGSAACAGIGLALRPDVTFLDSEHLVAYAVGVALANARVRERLAAGCSACRRVIRSMLHRSGSSKRGKPWPGSLPSQASSPPSSR